MISSLLAPFQNLSVHVEIDPLLLPFLDCPDRTSVNRTVTVNLFKLIYMIGTIQTRRFAPSRRQKFTDKSDLLEKLHTSTGEFRVMITNVQGTLGSEVLKTLSEDFGVGLSVLIAGQLFHIKDSTIQRIYANDKRPDWQCQTNANQLLVVESKGASSEATKRAQRANAISQKGTRPADIRVASLTLIREHEVSMAEFVDPPGDEPEFDPQSQRQIMRAGHYASAFSFLGHSALSRYFSQMRKRILNTISRGEQLEKDATFFRIRNEYTQINFRQERYAGTFTEVGDEQYLFIGVDPELVSYQGFLEFIDHEQDEEAVIENNHYIRFKDGILIIEIKNIQAFSYNVIIPAIPNYQQFTTITDIDAMTEISFEKYWLYVLTINGFQTGTQVQFSETIIDLVAFDDDKRYIFELKLFKRRQMNPEQAEQVITILSNKNANLRILVTNAEIPPSGMFGLGVVLIGRAQLQAIIRNPRRLRTYLDI
jgi:hypothetical protein